MFGHLVFGLLQGSNININTINAGRDPCINARVQKGHHTQLDFMHQIPHIIKVRCIKLGLALN